MDNTGKLFPALRDKLSHFLPRQGRDFVSAGWRILNFCSCT